MEKVCETDEVSEDLDLNLFDAGFIDSLSVISIIMEIEERTGLQLQPTDFDRNDIATVNHFKAFLERKVNDRLCGKK